MERTVPLILQHDHWYVRKDGKVVQISKRESVRSGDAYQFIDGDGDVYTKDGRWEQGTTHDRYDIARPVYQVGKTYTMQGGGTVTLTDDDDDDTYPLNGRYTKGSERGSSCWARTGMFGSDDDYTNTYNLGDYLAATSEQVQETKAMQDQQQTVTAIGARVTYQYEGVVLFGTVRYVSPHGSIAVEFDEGQTLPSGVWDCDGNVPSRRGWYVGAAELELAPAPAGWDVAETSVAPPAVAPRLLPREDRKLLWDTYSANVGFRGVTMADLIKLRRELDEACER